MKPDKIDSCSFRRAVTDYNNKNNTENLIMEPPKKQDCLGHDSDEFSDEPSDESNAIKLEQIYITSNSNKFFAGLFEIIYQVRNLIVHGRVNPDGDEFHEVVKYCYFILWDLMD